MLQNNYFSLELVEKDNILNNIIINEVYSMNILDKLINSSLLKEEFHNPYVVYENEKTQLLRYKELYDHNNGYSVVKLNRVKNNPFGRCNPEFSLSLFSIRRQIRHTICENLYYDFDIKNCHPDILYQICKFNNIECKNLEKYVLNRQYYIDLVMNTYNVSKDTSKNLFIRLLYGGEFYYWCLDNELKDVKNLDFIDHFTEEFKNISKIIYDNNPLLVKIITEQKLKNNKSLYNIYGSITSFYLQELEVQILEILFNYCIENRYIVNNECILAADGIMLLKKYIKNKTLDDICNEFHNIVLNQTGFNLIFVNKEFDESYSKILNKNIIFDLYKKPFLTGYISDYFKMMYGDKFIYNDNLLYYYNDVYWLEDDKHYTILHNFIDDKLYNNLLYNYNKLISELNSNINKIDKNIYDEPGRMINDHSSRFEPEKLEVSLLEQYKTYSNFLHLCTFKTPN